MKPLILKVGLLISLSVSCVFSKAQNFEAPYENQSQFVSQDMYWQWTSSKRDRYNTFFWRENLVVTDDQWDDSPYRS